MKISKKVLIPVFATAMGLSVIGGISGAVAWYQYNTKVTASFMGATIADGGTLQVSDDDGATWKRDVFTSTSELTLHPVTFGELASDDPIDGIVAKKHPEYGQESPTLWEDAQEGTEYHQLTFKIRAQKIVNDAYVDCTAVVNLEEFILQSVTSGKEDVADAVRVHIATSEGEYKLVSLNGGDTDVYGALDLDGNDEADIEGGYAWNYSDRELVYGVDGAVQSSVQLAEDMELFTVPEGGMDVTITVWLEGWHKFAGDTMAMWDPATTQGASIRLGLTLSTPKSTFDMNV